MVRRPHGNHQRDGSEEELGEIPRRLIHGRRRKGQVEAVELANLYMRPVPKSVLTSAKAYQTQPFFPKLFGGFTVGVFGLSIAGPIRGRRRISANTSEELTVPSDLLVTASVKRAVPCSWH